LPVMGLDHKKMESEINGRPVRLVEAGSQPTWGILACQRLTTNEHESLAADNPREVPAPSFPGQFQPLTQQALHLGSSAFGSQQCARVTRGPWVADCRAECFEVTFPPVKRYNLNFSTTAFLALLFLFFGAFLFYPVSFMLKGAFFAGGQFSLKYFLLLLESPLERESILNSFALAFLTTALTTLLALPLAHWMTRYNFPGKAWLGGLLLVPMIMPPFVG